MGFEIVVMSDCASNYGVFEVQSSDKSKTYKICLHGSKGPATCTCDGFKFRGKCRHVDLVYEEACLYNPQWHDAKKDPKIRPVSYTYDRFTEETCECEGPMVAVSQREGREAWRRFRDSLSSPVVMTPEDRESAIEMVVLDSLGEGSPRENLMDVLRCGCRGIEDWSDDELLDALADGDPAVELSSSLTDTYFEDGRRGLLAKYRGGKKP